MPKQRGRPATADKETIFLEIVEYIECNSDDRFVVTDLSRMMEEKLTGKNVSYLKPFVFCLTRN